MVRAAILCICVTFASGAVLDLKGQDSSILFNGATLQASCPDADHGLTAAAKFFTSDSPTIGGDKFVSGSTIVTAHMEGVKTDCWKSWE